MSILEKEQKSKTAKLVGSLFFLLLGLINFFATLFYSNVYLIDFVILFLGFLPLLVNRKFLFLIFGLLAGLISLYMGFACLVFNLNPEIATSQASYNMGYLLAVTTFSSSLLLVYVGLKSVESSAIEFA